MKIQPPWTIGPHTAVFFEVPAVNPVSDSLTFFKQGELGQIFRNHPSFLPTSS